MHNQPSVDALLDIIAEFMRKEAAPRLPGHTAFHARVAANALDIIRRELSLSPKSLAAEKERLEKLLGESGDLEALNRRLCERIASGEIDEKTPGFADHLWTVTLDKLAVDQPGFASYKAFLARHPDSDHARG
ncbi:MAG: DUF6285 domain-containing protein [Gammaproteobacteria bacterium]